MAKKTAAKVIDLMEALKKSLEDAKRGVRLDQGARRTNGGPMTETEKAREALDEAARELVDAGVDHATAYDWGRRGNQSRVDQAREEHSEKLDAYAAAIRAEERERCAATADSMADGFDLPASGPLTCHVVASAIRALSPTEVP